MKNLRKALSLALVVALSLSLAVAAGAKTLDEYTDRDSINPFRLEAVDLLTALGVFEGDENGALDPQGTFTRAQAAKIVSYISIGPSASNLTQAPTQFTDVPASHWASGYIAFATERGIINGTGGGLYDPDSPVTGAQLSKLLLVAIGYGAKGEYVGSSWELNSIIRGQQLGVLLLIGEVADLSAPATRQQAIQYVYNALSTQIVQYSAAFDSYLDASSSQFVTKKQTNLAAESFTAEMAFESDDFGYLENYWVQYGVRKTANYASDMVIGSFISNPEVTKGSLYAQYQWEDTIDLWINGYNAPWAPGFDGTYAPTYPSSNIAVRGSTSPALDATALGVPFLQGSLNGVHFDLIDNYPFDGKVAKVVARYEYLAKVTRVNTVTDTLNFNIYELSSGVAQNRPFENIPVDDASIYTRDQYILVTPSSALDSLMGYSYTSSTNHAPFISIKPAEVVTTTPSSYTKDRDSSIINSITINSEKKWIAATNFLPVADTTTLPDFTKEGVFYLDSNGYIVGFDSSADVAANLQYLYVHATTGAGSFGNSNFADNRVSVTYPDGTRATPTVAFRNYAAGTTGRNTYDTVGTATVANLNSVVGGAWFAYTVNSEGQVIINNLPTVDVGNVTQAVYGNSSSTSVTLTAGTPSIVFGTVTGSATSTTVLNINGSVYTGYSRFPNLKDANSTNSALVVYTQGPVSASDSRIEAKTTIAAIYIITQTSAGTGEYGVLVGLYSGGTVNSFTVRNAADEDEVLPDASGMLTVSSSEGTIVEIGVNASGDRQIVGTDTGTAISNIATDGTYIFDGTDYYYIGANTIIYDMTSIGAVTVETGDDVTIYDSVSSKNTPTSPLSVVVITAHAA
jgi:hypothetical protein